MKDKIVIVNNIVPKNSLEEIQGLFFSNDFPVYLDKTSCKYIENEKDLFPNKTTADSPQFFHAFISNYKQNSSYAHIPIGIFNEFKNKIGFNEVTLERCKYNITLARPDMDKLHLMPHIDSYVEGAYTSIFYINDSDGDTLFFDGDEIIFRYTPKANSMIFFPNNFVHCAELSKQTPYRAVLNYNFSLCE